LLQRSSSHPTVTIPPARPRHPRRQVGVRADALRELFSEHDRRDREDDPCPIESIEIAVMGPIARGVRKSVDAPSLSSTKTRRS
jgi:hypothetical protein